LPGRRARAAGVWRSWHRRQRAPRSSRHRQDEGLKTLLNQCKKLRDQQQSDKNKIYSLHEPDVQCISKGKAHKRFEFGQKVSVATTNRGNWFVGALLCKGNPYDGHTLNAALNQVHSLTGTLLTDVYVDKGYRGHDYDGGATVHIAGSRKKVTPTQRRRRKRRSAIEPKIGHAKSENRLTRCYLKGLDGDAMNVLLAAAGANFAKLLRLLPRALAIRLNHWLAHQSLNRHRLAVLPA
jgi:IS5 family transposase